jgi:hypothetical protein
MAGQPQLTNKQYNNKIQCRFYDTTILTNDMLQIVNTTKQTKQNWGVPVP